MQLYAPFVRSIAWIVAATVVSYLGVAVATLRGNSAAQPLRDILHELWTIPCPLWVPDMLLLLCLFCSAIDAAWPSERLVKRAALCYMLRAVTVSVTSMPACAPPIAPYVQKNWPLSNLLWVSRYDLMFSGHTIAFLFFAELWRAHTVAWMKAMVPVLRYAFPLTLVWARQHYTMDIIVAAVVWAAFRDEKGS